MEITCGIVGTPDHKFANKLNIYPNPTTGFLNLNGHDSIESVKVFDMSGKLVFSNAYHTSDVKLDLTFLTNGFYTALINENQRIKIIKN